LPWILLDDKKKNKACTEKKQPEDLPGEKTTPPQLQRNQKQLPEKNKEITAVHSRC